MASFWFQQRYAAMAPHILKALQSRGFESYFCADQAAAAAKILELIPAQHTVSWGGSLTLDTIGIKPALREAGYQLIDRETAQTPAERQQLMRQALLCGTYLSSVNAMTEDGIIVNIDGNCNRIAAIAYGPEQVILVTGMNKICRDLPSARHRAQTFAAPANGFRLNADLPCVKTGICHDCRSPQRMCAQIVEMHCCRIANRIKVILVGDDLGL